MEKNDMKFQFPRRQYSFIGSQPCSMHLHFGFGCSQTITRELTSCHRDRVGRTAWNIYSLLSEPFPAWLSGTLPFLWLTRKHMSKAILCHSWIQYACRPSNGRQQPHSAAFASVALTVILKAHHGLEYHNQGSKTHNCNLSKLNNKR